MSAVGAEVLPSVNEIYDSALAEHPDLLDYASGADIREVIGGTLVRIALFEDAARQPLNISQEAAENIGTVWVLSGTGSYETPFKPQDNPRLREDKPWLAWFDRARISQGVRLARQIAEVRSGQTGPRVAPGDIPAGTAQNRELWRNYGPSIVYNGYPIETAFAEALLDREGTVIPREKAHIIHADLKITADQVRTFEYPNDPDAKDKEVAIVTHAPHLAARVLPMANRYRPFGEQAVPYVAPVATPDAGRHDFAVMEARGQLFYTFKRDFALPEPHPYQMISQD